jgi:hypothetical protein
LALLRVVVATVGLLGSLEDTAFSVETAVTGSRKSGEAEGVQMATNQGLGKIFQQLIASLPQAGVFRIVLCAAIWPEIRRHSAIPAQNKLV